MRNHVVTAAASCNESGRVRPRACVQQAGARLRCCAPAPAPLSAGCAPVAHHCVQFMMEGLRFKTTWKEDAMIDFHLKVGLCSCIVSEA